MAIFGKAERCWGAIEAAGPSRADNHVAREGRGLGSCRAAAPFVGTLLAAVLLARGAGAVEGPAEPKFETQGWTAPDSAPAVHTPPERSPFAADLMVTTLLPLSVGPELDIELPGRVLAQVHLGWMPALYSSAITNGLNDAGVYDDTVGALVDGAFQGATSWRLGLGWRPFANAGLEIGASYVHSALDGATSTPEIMRLVPPALADQIAAQVGNVGVDLDSSIHHVLFSVGWRWLIADRFVMVANLGYMQAVDSRSEIDIEASPAVTSLAQPIVNAVLHDHYMQYDRIPVVGLGLGYRFF